MKKLVLCLALAGFADLPANAAEPKTPEAVIAADKGWGDAEANGDAEHLRRLLLPGYVSISEAGKTLDRETILAKAAQRGRSAEYASKVAAWRAAHPSTPQVTIAGDTAILTWRIGEGASLVRSCDVFAYVDGHWRALYSQHSAAQS